MNSALGVRLGVSAARSGHPAFSNCYEDLLGLVDAWRVLFDGTEVAAEDPVAVDLAVQATFTDAGVSHYPVASQRNVHGGHMLNEVAIRALKAGTKPRKVFDTKGLYLCW